MTALPGSWVNRSLVGSWAVESGALDARSILAMKHWHVVCLPMQNQHGPDWVMLFRQTGWQWRPW